MAGIPGVDEPSATIGCRVRNKRTKSARSERGPRTEVSGNYNPPISARNLPRQSAGKIYGGFF